MPASVYLVSSVFHYKREYEIHHYKKNIHYHGVFGAYRTGVCLI